VPQRPIGRAAWLLQWPSGHRKTIYLAALVLAAFTCFSVIYLFQIAEAYRDIAAGAVYAETHLPPTFGDFLALWSYPRIALTHPAIELYDAASLHARQSALGLDPAAELPFPYPPPTILLFWPLGLLPYQWAYAAWIVGTLALFLWALAATCSGMPFCVLGTVVAPATTVTIATGQSGFLAGALLVAGLRLAGRRPVLAGSLIGLLAYKPTLGLLAPVAFAAAGQWRAMAVSCATVVILAVLATLAFGPAIWSAWLSMLPGYVDLMARNTPKLNVMATVTANLQMLGVPLPAAKTVQALVAVAIAILVARCVSRQPGRLATAAILVGTLLATPHAYVYDLPMLTAAVALYVTERVDDGGVFTLAEIITLILVTAFPAVMMLHDVMLPVSTVPLTLFLGLILWSASGTRPCVPAPPHYPQPALPR